MRNSIISLDEGNSSDRGYNCEAKLSSEHFSTIYDSRVDQTFFRRVSKYGSITTISDKIKWDTLPSDREKAVSSGLFNVAIVLLRTLTYMSTYNIDLGGGGRGKVVLPN